MRPLPPNNDSESPSDQTDKDGILDQDSLERLRAIQRPGRPDIIKKLVEIYLKDAPSLMQSIHDSIDKDDANALWNAAHRLKSSSANLGALSLADTCKALEVLGSEGRANEALKLEEQLKTEYIAVSGALGRLINQ